MLSMACSTSKEALVIDDTEKELFNKKGNDTVRIAAEEDAEDEYEIIVIEPGFNYWLQSIARPRGFYSQSFLETRNRLFVLNWNQRVLQPTIYNPDLYLVPIDYEPNIDYGYEVNYKLYNYFIYFQRKYNQRLGPYFPRI
ncbi:DUF6146 family protein [Sungkyunkwania multivorans]|uniref:DUF6146 family protein n=1 Tax=Sungkyunkwania multivorans TaxID=1173618 RepID=A0ABW3CVX5_9FLAO